MQDKPFVLIYGVIFYKEHVRFYQKHPIYWQLNSGVDSGYKALIYMHRVNQKDLNGILHQLNLYAQQLEQQMTAQEFFDKKQRNRLIAKKMNYTVIVVRTKPLLSLCLVYQWMME